MNSPFNYNSLKVTFEKETRSVRIILNKPKEYNAFDLECLFELETLISWLMKQVEISSILVTTSSDYFSIGFDQEEIKHQDNEKILRLMSRLRNVFTLIVLSPQTYIFDLKKGVMGAASELALAADVRIIEEFGTMDFDFLKKGFFSSCGGFGYLSQLVGISNTKAWTFSGESIEAKELYQKGLVFKNYKADTRESLLAKILRNIHQQSPVARIQAKKAFADQSLPDLKRAWERELPLTNGVLSTHDWKEFIKSEIEGEKPNYMDPLIWSQKMQEEATSKSSKS